MLTIYEPTPCGVMFDLLKRRGGITHRELAGIVLSKRPLPSGRSPRDLAHERSCFPILWCTRRWGRSLPDTLATGEALPYACSGRLRSRRGRAMTADEVVSMLAGEPGRAMDRALELCREDACLYRNARRAVRRGRGSCSRRACGGSARALRGCRLLRRRPCRRVLCDGVCARHAGTSRGTRLR